MRPNFMHALFEGQNFRHNLYPAYKSNRPPTPDTIVQGLQYLKASIKAMAIKVIEASCGFISCTGLSEYKTDINSLNDRFQV